MIKNEYIVLARKYRPKRFSDIIGQDEVCSVIEGAIKQPDYIKIDVDGAELSVLEGSPIVLQNAQEVQVELRKKNADQAEKFLNKLGYIIDYDASYRLNEYEINYVFKR